MDENKDILVAIEQEKAKVAEMGLTPTVFDKPKETAVEEKEVDTKDEILNTLLNQGVVHEIKNNEELQKEVLDTAKVVAETKMKVFRNKADKEHKKAVFENNEAACSCYGFKEKSIPLWAVTLMNIGYSIMLFIWWLVGTFTFMPVVFIFSKIQVGLKHTWMAVILSVLIYLAVAVGIPALSALVGG